MCNISLRFLPSTPPDTTKFADLLNDADFTLTFLTYQLVNLMFASLFYMNDGTYIIYIYIYISNTWAGFYKRINSRLL